jgi:hypothetical protein
MAITRVPHKGQTSMPGHLTAAPNPPPAYHRQASEMTLRSVEDVAQQFDVVPRTICNWIKGGDLPAIKIKRRYLIDDNDITHFILTRRGLV